MRLLWIMPYLILAVLIFYTNFKIIQFLPDHRIFVPVFGVQLIALVSILKLQLLDLK